MDSGCARAVRPACQNAFGPPSGGRRGWDRRCAPIFSQPLTGSGSNRACSDSRLRQSGGHSSSPSRRDVRRHKSSDPPRPWRFRAGSEAGAKSLRSPCSSGTPTRVLPGAHNQRNSHASPPPSRFEPQEPRFSRPACLRRRRPFKKRARARAAKPVPSHPARLPKGIQTAALRRSVALPIAASSVPVRRPSGIKAEQGVPVRCSACRVVRVLGCAACAAHAPLDRARERPG
jgi:hypothetical protein